MAPRHERKMKENASTAASSIAKETTKGKNVVHEKEDKVEAQEEFALWAPSVETVASLLLLPRMASALLNPIADCDETFNYWEPLHYLLYGFGFQTWEYSPVYALRSYVYIGFHAVIAKLSSLGLALGVMGGAAHEVSKMMVFYSIRGALGLICSNAEAYFYRTCVDCFGKRTGRYLLWFLLFNAGLFHSSTALLPSSFVMYLMMMFMHTWMQKQYYRAMTWGIIAVLCGWPYVSVLFLPFAMETLYVRGIFKSVAMGVIIGVAIVALEIGMNFLFYQRWVLPAWNIVHYNVLSGETDSSLYGTEPWTFYVLNLALNFNVVILLALPVVLFVYFLPSYYHVTKLQLVAYLSPLYIWLLIMFAQPHKEERFLFPIYPLVCLAAAVTLSTITYQLRRIFGPKNAFGNSLRLLVVVGILSGYALLSISRIVSNTVNFSAPLRVYLHLHEHVLPNDARGVLLGNDYSVNLCVGKEWHRFPTNFFIPTNATKVQFLKSAFAGQLPKHFEQHENGTSVIPSEMNNQNREEPGRYVDLSECDYVVDLNLPDQQETKFWEETSTWEIVHSERFLDAETSKSPYRSFYIPGLTAKHVQYADYVVYKRKNDTATLTP